MATDWFITQLIIIGKGPAACSAALFAKHHGLNVCLVAKTDKKKADKPKPLQSLYPDINSLLKVIDCEDILINCQLGQYSSISINGEETSLSEYPQIPDIGYHIDRIRFDQLLLKKAEDAGIKVMKDRVCKLLQSGDTIEGIETAKGKKVYSKFVIDASGVSRFAGKALQIPEVYYSPEFIVSTGLIEDEKNFGKQGVFDFFTEKHGWHWIVCGENTPLTWTRLSLKESHDISPPKPLRHLKVLDKAHAQNMTWRMFEFLSLPGLLLAGDAACVVDPASGQGIHTAILSGLKASQAVVDSLNEPSRSAFALKNYKDWYSAYFKAKCDELREYYDILGLQLFN